MKNKIQTELYKIEQIYQSLDFSDRSIYSEWLAQTYFFVKHSTRLLSLSAGLCPFEIQFFHHRALQHAHEEKSHEKLLELDLKNLGYNVSSFSELSATSTFYQAQYYAIQNINPLSFLGYVYLLEHLSISLGAKMYDQLKDSNFASSTYFLKVHAEDDVEHVDELHKLVLMFDQDTQNVILKNLRQSSFLYASILSQIAESAQLQKKLAA